MYGRGHLIFNKNETLFAQPFDVTRLSITGEPIILATSAGRSGSFASLAVSENGVLSYGGVNSSARSQLSVVDRNGQIVRHLGAEGLFDGVGVSPDCLMVATTVFGALSIVDTTRGLPNKLTPGKSGSDRFPLWARDSSSMVFTSFDAVTRASGVSRMVLGGRDRQGVIASRPPREVIATDWSRDGRFIVYSETDRGQADLHLLTLASGTHRPLVASPFDERDGRLSPDGQWLAYASDESGRIEVYLQSLAGGSRTLRISTDGGVEPRWRPDGRELFYRAASGGLMAVPITGTRGQMALGAPEQLVGGIRWASRGGPHSWTYDVMPDGRHFVVNAFPTTTVSPDLTVVLNWPALLTKQ